MNLELISSAGNLESFLSAIENGADSVYLGLKKFNARRPAKNFTVNQFKKAIQYAHSKDKKVYLTLNIDLKSNELKEAVEILEFVNNNKVDGIIVKDPAILFILKTFYPEIEIHFSTQNAIESSYGVRSAKTQSVKRAVLARELAIEEIKKCSLIPETEIEIFAEGSMCFSISGKNVCLINVNLGWRS